MISTRWIYLLVLWLFPWPALATPLVADMSTYRIDMDANFSGTRIFLFGARNDTGDVIIVIRGPAKNYILRKKEKVAGVWINSSRMKLFAIPAFYRVMSNTPLSSITQANLFTRLGIGEQTLLAPYFESGALSNYRPYADAFLEYQHDQKRFFQNEKGLEFMGETLFKTVIEFPDNIPPGPYTAEIYLVSDGKITGQQTLPLNIVKSGLDAWLYNYAHNWPMFYGLSAILLAMGIGWFAGRVFENLERSS